MADVELGFMVTGESTDYPGRQVFYDFDTSNSGSHGWPYWSLQTRSSCVMTKEKALECFKNATGEGRDSQMRNGVYQGTIRIMNVVAHDVPNVDQIERDVLELQRQAALERLTEHQKEILGVK